MQQQNLEMLPGQQQMMQDPYAANGGAYPTVVDPDLAKKIEKEKKKEKKK